MLGSRKMKVLEMKKVKTKFSKKSLFQAQILDFGLYFCVESDLMRHPMVPWEVPTVPRAYAIASGL